MREIIIKKLQENLDPEFLEVIDESYMHAGHGDFGGEAGTHFRLLIKAAKLASLSRIKAHQQIYHILAEELSTSVHALAIEIKK